MSAWNQIKTTKNAEYSALVECFAECTNAVSALAKHENMHFVLCIFGGRDLISCTNYVCNCECVPTRWSTNVLSVSVQAFEYNLYHIWFNLALLTLSANSYKTNLSTNWCWSSYVIALVHCALHRADLKVVCLYSHWERLYSLSGDTSSTSSSYH